MDKKFFRKIGLLSPLVIGLSLSLNACRKANGTVTEQAPGVNASMHGKLAFPVDNPWNQRVDRMPVDPKSDLILHAIGENIPLHPDFGSNYNGKPFGIPYVVLSGSVPKIPVSFLYEAESDAGPYPIPPNPPIEGGPESKGDRHLILVDRERGLLYELYSVYANGVGGYKADSGAIFDLNSNEMRPAGWTSADAAGLPIFPGLVRYDEAAERKEIRHALRFTVKRTRNAYIYPARHFASRNADPSLPPMGMRVRLKASFDLSGYPPEAQAILKALKTYGMILADNGGNWFISGTPDPRWDDGQINALKRVKVGDFEVVSMNSEDKLSEAAQNSDPSLVISKIGEVSLSDASESEVTLPPGADPERVPVEVIAKGLPDGAIVNLKSGWHKLASSAVKRGQANFVIELPVKGVSDSQVVADLEADAKLPINQLPNQPPSVKGIVIQSAIIATTLKRDSSIYYLTEKGEKYDWEELLALSKK